MSDLEEAIALNKDALELRTRGRANRSCLSLNDLAVYLSTRYNRLRRLVDLDEGILAICFSTRDDHLPGKIRISDLEEAVAMHRDWIRAVAILIDQRR